ncbi:hypothetical protein BDZ45DRAFT_699580 [Acephala macrosclerotiorum]|nr:hypothetical protein BDZ45DRAFT_699580 [Acephala macrosclerotiorum]
MPFELPWDYVVLPTSKVEKPSTLRKRIKTKNQRILKRSSKAFRDSIKWKDLSKETSNNGSGNMPDNKSAEAFESKLESEPESEPPNLDLFQPGYKLARKELGWALVVPKNVEAGDFACHIEGTDLIFVMRVDENWREDCPTKCKLVSRAVHLFGPGYPTDGYINIEHWNEDGRYRRRNWMVNFQVDFPTLQQMTCTSADTAHLTWK